MHGAQETSLCFRMSSTTHNLLEGFSVHTWWQHQVARDWMWHSPSVMLYSGSDPSAMLLSIMVQTCRCAMRFWCRRSPSAILLHRFTVKWNYTMTYWCHRPLSKIVVHGIACVFCVFTPACIMLHGIVEQRDFVMCVCWWRLPIVIRLHGALEQSLPCDTHLIRLPSAWLHRMIIQMILTMCDSLPGLTSSDIASWTSLQIWIWRCVLDAGVRQGWDCCRALVLSLTKFNSVPQGWWSISTCAIWVLRRCSPKAVLLYEIIRSLDALLMPVCAECDMFARSDQIVQRVCDDGVHQVQSCCLCFCKHANLWCVSDSSWPIQCDLICSSLSLLQNWVVDVA